MRKFRAGRPQWVRYFCSIFALVCLFFVLFSHLHHCHGTDCPVCALQELLENTLPAAAFTGLLKLLFALFAAGAQAKSPNQGRTLVELKVKLSD